MVLPFCALASAVNCDRPGDGVPAGMFGCSRSIEHFGVAVVFTRCLAFVAVSVLLIHSRACHVPSRTTRAWFEFSSLPPLFPSLYACGNGLVTRLRYPLHFATVPFTAFPGPNAPLPRSDAFLVFFAPRRDA